MLQLAKVGSRKFAVLCSRLRYNDGQAEDVPLFLLATLKLCTLNGKMELSRKLENFQSNFHRQFITSVEPMNTHLGVVWACLSPRMVRESGTVLRLGSSSCFAEERSNPGQLWKILLIAGSPS